MGKVGGIYSGVCPMAGYVISGVLLSKCQLALKYKGKKNLYRTIQLKI
jgi:hypothetical protein